MNKKGLRSRSKVWRKLGKLRDATKLFIFGLPKFAVGSIDVTNRCNLRCEHCYFFAEDHDNERELSVEKWVEKLEAMKADGHPMMLCTWVGGEPMVRKQLIEAGRQFRAVCQFEHRDDVVASQEYVEVAYFQVALLRQLHRLENNEQVIGAFLNLGALSTVAAVLEIVGEKRLLDRQPVLRRSIELRNPYVDPMNQVQIELLRRWRAGGGEDVRRPLMRSIAGIAAALRNTG